MIGHFKKKYTMKCEPHGTSNLDFKIAKRFGLQNASKMQLQLISNLIISKHVSLPKEIFICLKIPIIQKSKNVKSIDSKPIIT
jgi:hypothetical protein